MLEFVIGTGTGAWLGWSARARWYPAADPQTPASDSQRRYLQHLTALLAGAQQLATDDIPDPWDPELSTQRASALLDQVTALKNCVSKEARTGFHVQENCAFARTVLDVRREYSLKIDQREADALERVWSGGASTAISCTLPTEPEPEPDHPQVPAFGRCSDMHAAGWNRASARSSSSFACRRLAACRFPHVNGDLFDGAVRIPVFDAEMRRALLDAGQFDWTAISPAIFGALFQSVMEPADRRAQGAH